MHGVTRDPDAPELVVLVHGIWMTGLDMSLLGRRIRSAGYACKRFRYRSVRRSPAENAERLARFLEDQTAGTVHLVAHSLGGIVVLHLLDRFPQVRPGRVVMLCTPARGSGVARRISRIPVLRRALGKSVDQGVLGGAPKWRGGRDLGVMAGTRFLGLGSLFGGVEKPGDGTVAVAEARCPEAADTCILHASHTGVLCSRKAAQAVCRFLRTGRFKD